MFDIVRTISLKDFWHVYIMRYIVVYRNNLQLFSLSFILKDLKSKTIAER